MTFGSREGSPGQTPGFSAGELLVSLVVFGVITTVTLSFLQVQSRGFKNGLDYMATAQTVRRAMGILDQNIQAAGTNLVPGQPGIVYADQNVFAFNADFSNRHPDEPSPVFSFPDLQAPWVGTPTGPREIGIPGTDYRYPDPVDGSGRGLPAPAETIILFFTPDSSTARPDDYSLFRQVDTETPELLAGNLFRSGSEPFFLYMKEGELTVDSVPEEILPLAHSGMARAGGSAQGRSSSLDSITAVRVTLAAGESGDGLAQGVFRMSRLIRMPNVRLRARTVCGRQPVLDTDLEARVLKTSSGESVVSLSWGRSADEGGGEDDIMRYVIWRRDVKELQWADPYLSVPAGRVRYEYEDADLRPGAAYQYALASQDCTPALSPRISSQIVTVPRG